MKKAKTLLIKNKDELEFVDLQMPVLNDYEVLFKTKYCSLCTVDRRTYKGTRNYGYPFLGGHECSGVVEAVGKGVVEINPGDHVIFTSGYCNQCELDRSGRGTQCKNKKQMPKRANVDGNILGGGLSEYLAIPAWQVIKLPEDVNMAHAALTEPLACCIHSIEKARIELGDTVVIIGMGIMGYFQLKLAQMKGARVIVSEMDEARKRKAIGHGAAYVLDPSKENVVERVKELTNGLGAEVVINTIPTASVWGDAIDMLAPYGRLIAYSSQDSKDKIGVDFGLIHSKEIELIGTLNPNIDDNERATRLIRYQMINMDEVIDETYTFEDGMKAFEKACEPNTYRVMIRYD
ncbi:zinc-dependent alcohol dehydrogenase [Amedibacillus sp. YH-ame6]